MTTEEEGEGQARLRSTKTDLYDMTPKHEIFSFFFNSRMKMEVRGEHTKKN